MRSNFVLLVGLSAVFVFLGIYGTSFVNGQTSANNSSAENGTSSASSVLQTDNLDPFKSKTSSNVNGNNPSQAGADTSIANDDSATNDDTADSNNDDSSSNDKNDESDRDGSDDDKSSPDDIPFP